MAAAKKPVAKSGKRQTRTAELWIAGADPYRPTKRAVVIGLEGEDHVEIVKGIKPGEKVLVRSKSLRDDEDDDSEESDTEVNVS